MKLRRDIHGAIFFFLLHSVASHHSQASLSVYTEGEEAGDVQPEGF